MSTEVVAKPTVAPLAVVGFIVSFLWVLGPVGMALSIAAIFQTRRGQRPGFGLAVAGVVIGALWTAIILVGVLATVMIRR